MKVAIRSLLARCSWVISRCSKNIATTHTIQVGVTIYNSGLIQVGIIINIEFPVDDSFFAKLYSEKISPMN